MKLNYISFTIIRVLIFINAISEITMGMTLISSNYDLLFKDTNLSYLHSIPQGSVTILGWHYIIIGILTILIALYFFKQKDKSISLLHRNIMLFYTVVNLYFFILLFVMSNQIPSNAMGLLSVPLLYLICYFVKQKQPAKKFQTKNT